MALRLYTYWRSSAAFRVRIALALKGLDYESIPRHLLRDGGEQRRADYLALNPQGLVPALEHDGTVITQSLAICEYLEEVFPRPALLPVEPGRPGDGARDGARGRLRRPSAQQPGRAAVPARRDRCQPTRPCTAGCGTGSRAASARSSSWSRAIRPTGATASAAGVTLADVFLVPQVYNARRAQLDLAPYPRLAAITQHLESLPAFAAARPESQPDAE